jgi:hypothetical protein
MLDCGWWYRGDFSPLGQKILSVGKTVGIEINEDCQGGWLLQVVDEHDNSTVWEDSFPANTAALAGAKRNILAKDLMFLGGRIVESRRNS